MIRSPVELFLKTPDDRGTRLLLRLRIHAGSIIKA